MDVKDFYYDLPQELIAQDPLEDRSSSRLMVLDKITGEVEHRHFKDIVGGVHNRVQIFLHGTSGNLGIQINILDRQRFHGIFIAFLRCL